MTTTTTATEPVEIEFDCKLLHEMRTRAEGSGCTLSNLVNDEIRLAIEVEDAAELPVFEETKDEPSRPFEEFVAEMRACGEL